VALSGGIGGAKLALGLSRVLPSDELLIVANTGDDFEHLGLSISPDIDTLIYVLAGLDNPVTGWGRRDETWSFMDSIGALGGEDWFRLGDRDLALHVERTRRQRLGQTLSEVTSDICRRLGIGARVVPMSDDRVRTRVRADTGWIDFQDYFVRQQCRPVVHELAFDGVTLARPHPDIAAALRSGDARAVIVCPSNPFISVEPILAIPGMRDAIRRPLATGSSRSAVPWITSVGSDSCSRRAFVSCARQACIWVITTSTATARCSAIATKRSQLPFAATAAGERLISNPARSAR
jgi:LPPG:FO 2-phospho-L-lactate transferase